MNIYELAKEAEAKFKSLKYPKRLSKPGMPSNNTSASMREYADKLEQYEVDFAKYNEDVAKYNEEQNVIYADFKEKLFNLYDGFSKKQLDIIYGKAYEDSHSEGIYSVASTFNELVDFAKELIGD